MYKRFFGLHENPFNVNPDPRYLFLTPQTRGALDDLTCGIQARKGLMLLTGEVGTGKTTLLNRLLDRLRHQQTSTAFIFNSHLKVSHLFDFILADFAVAFDSELKGNAVMRLHQWLLERYRAGDTPVVIVDEAQGLPNPVLKEIRMLLNLETSSEKLLQIILAGQPELDERLRQPELRQVKQCIALRCQTAVLTLAEAHDYIQARLHIAGGAGRQVFSSEAMDAVHFYSRGIPRVTNLLCEQALINAYVDHVQPVPAHIIAEVARELQFDDVQRVAPTIDSAAGSDANRIPTQSRGTNALVSVSATSEAIWEEQPDPLTTRSSGPFVGAHKLPSSGQEPTAAPVLEAEKIRDMGDAGTFTPSGFQLTPPTVLGLRQVEARLLAECSAFVSDVGASLVSGTPAKSAPLARSPGLHIVEAKGKLDLLPGFRRQVSGPQRPLHPASKGKAAKSGPLNSGVIKIIALRLILVRWSRRWKDCFLSAVTSPGWTRRTAAWTQLPRRWRRPVRAWYWESLAWGHRCLSIVDSIDWPRLKTSAYRWLRQPCDPTRWRLADLRLFEGLLKFSHRKM